MIKKEIRRAKQRKDWQTVKELQEILKLAAETRKLEADEQLAQANAILAKANAIKTQAEVSKINFDKRFSFINMIFGTAGLVSMAVMLIKESDLIQKFFQNK